MPNDTPEEVVGKIVDAFSAVLDTVVVSTAAVKVLDNWHAFHARVSITNGAVTETPDNPLIFSDSAFVAVRRRYAINELSRILQNIAAGYIEISEWLFTARILLSRSAAATLQVESPLSFRPMSRLRRSAQVGRHSRLQLTYYTATETDPMYELLGNEELETISSKLRLHRPPVNGINGLLNSFGTNISVQASQSVTIEIVIEVPFFVAVRGDAIQLQCPFVGLGQLRIVYFFSPHGTSELSAATSLEESGRYGIADARFETPWTGDANGGTAHIYFGSELLDTVELGRWSGTTNWRFSVDDFFDPGQYHLNQAIGGKLSSGEFEHLIVRILGLAGLAIVWYGAIREKGKPDLAGCHETSEGKWVTLLGECTIEKPLAKLTPLTARADALRLQLAGKVEIVPVVFAACDPAASDYAAAAQAKVTLIGKNEIPEILALAKASAGPEALLNFLVRRMQSASGWPGLERL